MSSDKNPDLLVGGVYIADPKLRARMRAQEEEDRKPKKRGGLIDRQLRKNTKYRSIMEALEGDR